MQSEEDGGVGGALTEWLLLVSCMTSLACLTEFPACLARHTPAFLLCYTLILAVLTGPLHLQYGLARALQCGPVLLWRQVALNIVYCVLFTM